MPKSHAVGEQHPVVPLARRRRRPAISANSSDDDDADQPGAAADDLVVALDELLLGPGGPERGAMRSAIERFTHSSTKNTPVKMSAERDLGAEHAATDAREAERVEPEVVGVEAGDPAQRGDEQHQRRSPGR